MQNENIYDRISNVLENTTGYMANDMMNCIAEIGKEPSEDIFSVFPDAIEDFCSPNPRIVPTEEQRKITVKGNICKAITVFYENLIEKYLIVNYISFLNLGNKDNREFVLYNLTQFVDAAIEEGWVILEHSEKGSCMNEITCQYSHPCGKNAFKDNLCLPCHIRN